MVDIIAQPQELSCLLIELTGSQLLVPSNSVAELTSHTLPTPIPSTPDWLLGTVPWRNQHCPLVLFESLAFNTLVPTNLRFSRVAVINAASQRRQFPFWAMAVQSIPRLVRITQDRIQQSTSADHNPLAQPASYNEQRIWIPDFSEVEKKLRDLNL